MKTLKLELKKKLLIVDAISQDIANGIIFQKFGVKTLSEFEFICKGSELTEEIASELVDFWQNMANDGFIYENYKTNLPKKKTAKESFISAVESKGFYWMENPVKIHTWASENADEYRKKWQEAEEKTFRNPLIFVKK